MFYGRAFFGSLIYNACLSVIFFGVTLVFGPTLSQTLGSALSAALVAVLTLLVRAFVAKFYAEEMWERAAPMRRIALNILPAAFAGHFFVYLPLTMFGTLQASTEVLAGLLVDSLLVVAASYAGILMGKKEPATA